MNLIGCPSCNTNNRLAFFELNNMPTMDGKLSNNLKEAFSVPLGNIHLAYCKFCGYSENISHEPEKISFEEYDFSVFHSPTFAQYLDQIISRLILKHRLTNKTILELGSGDGYFLRDLCKKGGNKGIGIDPGFDHKDVNQTDYSVRFLQEHYSGQHADLKPDFIFCRHVLNAVPDPISFLKLIRKNIENNPDCTIYIEVPNAHYTFGQSVLWNVAYEHKSWYTPASLALMLKVCGFEILDVYTCWKDEFLAIEARPGAISVKEDDFLFEFDILQLGREIRKFQKEVAKIKEKNIVKINELDKKGIKAVMWGAGARGLTFLNMFKLKDTVQSVVDINPLRQGKFMPGTGHQVISPEQLKEIEPELIIINNPTYEKEIKQHVYELGLTCDFWVLNQT